MTTLEVLRIACKANGLSCHGSSAVLVKRLLTADVKTKSKTTNAKHKKDCAKLVKRLLTAYVKTKSKTTNAKHNKMNKGERMSASYYFHEICACLFLAAECAPGLLDNLYLLFTQFWVDVGADGGGDWRRTFVRLFGLTPDAFYRAFTAFLARPLEEKLRIAPERRVLGSARARRLARLRGASGGAGDVDESAVEVYHADVN